MRPIGEPGYLISDIGGPPGCLGDSMANTSRWQDLLIASFSPIILVQFITETSYTRCPDSRLPTTQDWAPSSDQCIPWVLVLGSTTWVEQMAKRFKNNGWRTPDGNIVQPALYAILNENWNLLAIVVAAQALLFKLPFRWDDGQKKFVSSANSSADYLNWYHCAKRCPKWVLKLVSKDVLKAKIWAYFLPEPDVQWLLDLYNTDIEKSYA